MTHDRIATATGVFIVCLMAPATIVLIAHPSRMWLHGILAPSGILTIRLCLRRRSSPSERLGLRRPITWRWYGIGLLLGVLLPIGLLPLWQTIAGHGAEDTFEILPVVYASPIWEELAFRGVVLSVSLTILNRLRPWPAAIRNDVLAAVVAALLFAACHMVGFRASLVWSASGARYFVDFAISGLLFATLRIRSQSLLPSIVMHATTNLTEWMLIFGIF